MKFLADENVEIQLVERLRSENYEVLYVSDLAPCITDDEVLELANKENAILLTGDKDFGELVFRLGLVSKGVVLLRLGELSLTEKIGTIVKAIREHESELPSTFTVVSANSIRIRKNI
jgi:predicted nuclease of predicted toxin-antitoxin system